MLGYVEGILAEQSVLTEEQIGFGFFEPSVFALGREEETGEDAVGFRRRTVYSAGVESPVEGDLWTVGQGKREGAVEQETGKAVMPRGASFQDVLQQEVALRDVLPREEFSGEFSLGGVWEGGLSRGSLSHGGVVRGGLLQGGQTENRLVTGDVVASEPFIGAVKPVVSMEREVGLAMERGRGFDLGGFMAERQQGENLPVAVHGKADLGGEPWMGKELALAQGDFSVMAQGTARLLAESVMVLERQMFEMGTEPVLLSGEEMGVQPLTTEAVAREMVYLQGEAEVLPRNDWEMGQKGQTEFDGTGEVAALDRPVDRGGSFFGERRSLLPWAVEGMASVLPWGNVEATAKGEQASVTEVALLAQMRTMDTATVGKTRVERETVSAVALEQAEQGLRTLVSGGTGATVEDFDRAVARDARRYDGI